MKHILLYTVLIIINGYSFVYSKSENDLDQTNLLSEIRIIYYSAVENEERINDLEKIITSNYSEEQSNYPPLILAYCGGVEALKAKHAFWPFTKLSLLNKSMEIFKVALQENPENLEIRFLRFSILHYIPSILGYSDERNEDIIKITELINTNNIGPIDLSLQKGIIEFMIESERLNNIQNELLNEKLVNIRNE